MSRISQTDELLTADQMRKEDLRLGGRQLVIKICLIKMKKIFRHADVSVSLSGSGSVQKSLISS